jgi:hypothetical protein
MLGISKTLKTKAAKTVDVMIVSGEETKQVIGAKGFFVTSLRELPEGLMCLHMIKRDEVEYFLCQQIRGI